MKKDLIFFSEDNKGLTSTSANHIANLGKEYITNLEKWITTVTFVDEEVSLISSVTANSLSTGISKEMLNDIPNNLKIIANIKSLIAWIREAIKAKNNLTKELNDTSLEEWAELNNIELPIQPKKEESLDEDTYLSNLSIKERNRYYELETLCAVIGKYIHPEGTLSKARKDLNDKIIHPHKVEGNGRDTLIYRYTPTIKANDVEEVFFTLQNQHREAQAELNSIKYKMETAISIDDTDKQAKYLEEFSKYKENIDIIYEKFTLWKKERQREIQNLKIIIPNSLIDAYNKVSTLGKKK